MPVGLDCKSEPARKTLIEFGVIRTTVMILS